MAMENPRTLPLNFSYFPQDHRSFDHELRQSFLLTMELEDTRIKAHEELKAKDEEISQLKDLLTRAIKERDEAQEKCRKLMLEKFLLPNSNSGVSSVEDEVQKKGIDSINGFSSSDCDESIVSSPRQMTAPRNHELDFPTLPNAALPEKGKLLEAVIKAGPLLQTLLLAGPLPQWRHPPPPLDTNQIPPFPVAIPSPTTSTLTNQGFNGESSFPDSSINGRKRGALSDGQDSPPVKCQRMILLH